MSTRFRSLSVVLVATGLWAVSAAEPARAQSSTNLCTVRGVPVMPFGLSIYDQARGGTPIARFTGASTALAASDFFAQRGKRAQVRTGTGTGSFRIAGWVDADDVPIFTKEKVPVVSGHLWIAADRQVSVTSAGRAKLRIERKASSPIQQTFTTWASCSSLHLTERSPSGHTVPGHARGYVVKRDSVELFDDADADRKSVTVLRRDPSSTGILLWSERKRGEWVNVEYHGDVILDAWARAAQLSALPPGETMDQQRPPSVRRSAPRLKLAETPRVVRTTKELPIRVGASDTAKVIGRVEAGTETYVLDIVAGWASVLPKSLHVAPHGDGQFWVKADDLGGLP
jgi:hypothetical protein